MPPAIAHRSDGEIISPPDEMDLLYRRWKSAIKLGALPPYEDVALGGLGRLNEHLAIVRTNEQGRLEILRAGRRFETWLGAKIDSALVDDLRADCALALTDCITIALQRQEPSRSMAHQVRDGFVETFDLMALPLKSLWGPPLFLVLIKQHERRYSLVETIFDATDEGMLALEGICDEQRDLVDFRIIALNEGAARLMNQPRALLQWKRLSETKLHCSTRGLFEQLATAIAICQQGTFEVSYPEGSITRHLKIAIVPVGDLLSLTLTDVGEIKSREQSFRLLFESNPVPMWLLDQASLRFLEVNDAAVQHYGYSRPEFMEMSALEIRPIEDHDSARQLLTGLVGAYEADRAWRHIKSDGSAIEVFPYLRVLVTDAKPRILAALFDVTERRKAEARVVHMAHHDALTNLPNRVLFRDRLENALARVRRHGESLAVLCIDLDHFKSALASRSGSFPVYLAEN
jgi:PAS domain S-box-containing protein